MPDQQAIAHAFERLGHEVRRAAHASQALESVRLESIDVVVADACGASDVGLELVRRIQELDPDLPCLALTPDSSPEHAAAAIRAGAFGAIERPLERGNLDLLRLVALQAIEFRRLRAENRRLHQVLDASRKFEAVVGKSARLARALGLLERVADSATPILLVGEPGTGKRLLARAIHHNGRRSTRAFVAVDCASLPETILARELFGDPPVDGAAVSPLASLRRSGFAAADRGTLYLSAIDALPLDLQARLTRFLESNAPESRNSTRVSEGPTSGLDVRLVVGSRVRLEDRVATGRFRSDLFARLSALCVEVPALRDRIDDLPLLVHHFVDRARATQGSRLRGISDEALMRLADHHWPGNVRELESLIERLALLVGDGEIEVHDLPESVRAEPALRTWAPRLPSTGLDFNDVVTRFENDLIEQALEQTTWNKNRAAKLLRLNRTTLVEKIKKRGLLPRTPLL